MKKLLLFSLLFFGFTYIYAQCSGADVLKLSQDFEPAEPQNFTVENMTAAYPCSGVDTVTPIATVGGITPQNGTQFLGFNDVQGNCDSDGNIEFLFTITADADGNYTTSFFYTTVGFDAGDDLGYEVLINGTQIVNPGADGDNLVVGGTGGVSAPWTQQSDVFALVTGDILELRFYIDQNGNADSAGFDNVTICGPAVVTPVELTDFSASLNENDEVELAWSTSSEDNNSHFEVQHSTDGITWVEIGEVAGAGTTDIAQSYSFTDTTPAVGTNLYRLRQVDFDGAAEFSDVIAAEVGSAIRVTSYDGNRIEVFTPERGDLNIAVYNAVGQVVKFENQNAQRGNNSFDASDLNQGIYFVRFQLNNKQFVYKIVK